VVHADWLQQRSQELHLIARKMTENHNTGARSVGSVSLRRCAAGSLRSWWASHSRRLELGCLLGAAALLIRLVLQGPQGAQRRLLGLGEPADARDVEPLVGPVATQGA
jgi:hypothetical protein